MVWANTSQNFVRFILFQCPPPIKTFTKLFVIHLVRVRSQITVWLYTVHVYMYIPKSHPCKSRIGVTALGGVYNMDRRYSIIIARSEHKEPRTQVHQTRPAEVLVDRRCCSSKEIISSLAIQCEIHQHRLFYSSSIFTCYILGPISTHWLDIGI